MTTTRRQAREWAIQMLTAADLNPGVDIDTIIGEYWAQLPTLDAEDGGIGEQNLRTNKLKAFAEARVRGVLASVAEIDATLNGLLKDWSVDRLGTVERVVLRMGIWEIGQTDIPAGVVINEAIDLVNWFSSPKSRGLVNGVLDKYAKMK